MGLALPAMGESGNAGSRPLHTASPTLFLWAGILLVAVRVSSTPRSLTWIATWAPNAPATWRRTALAELPGAKMTDLVRLAAGGHPCAAELVRRGGETAYNVVGRLPSQSLGEEPPIVRISAEPSVLGLVRCVPHT